MLHIAEKKEMRKRRKLLGAAMVALTGLLVAATAVAQEKIKGRRPSAWWPIW
jgi:hypothetical protein